MHLHARYTGADVIVQGLATPPFGPGFAPALLRDADALEVWVTTFRDPADTTVWRLMRAGRAVAVMQVGGF
jgi:hypothetical protein